MLANNPCNVSRLGFLTRLEMWVQSMPDTALEKLATQQWITESMHKALKTLKKPRKIDIGPILSAVKASGGIVFLKDQCVLF